MKGKTLCSFVSLMLLTFVLTISANQKNIHFQEGDEYLAFATQMPTPIGGLEAIYKKIKYPKLALQAGLEGKVYLIAYINAKGIATDVKVIKKLGGGCDEAATEVIKKTKFTPGVSEGKSVNVKLSLQIQFKLEK
ncbi:MAG: energy transducer TonB [Melioribacteraceae bacterium]